MMRFPSAFRLLCVTGLASGLLSTAQGQEAPKSAPQPPAATTPRRTILPTPAKPTQVEPPKADPTKPATVAPALPAPRAVEAPKADATTGNPASRTVTVTVMPELSNWSSPASGSDCDCNGDGSGSGDNSPKTLTPAQTRQLEALMIDRLSPTEAPRYGRNEAVPPINCEVPAGEAYVEGLRALKRFDSARALALFNHALSIDPTHPATLQLKAVALYDLGRDAEAAKAARQGKYFAREQPGGLEELSRALEPIQGHRRSFLDMAALYNLTGEPQDCCNPGMPSGVMMGAPVTPENPLKPGVIVDPAPTVEPKPAQPGVVTPPVAPKPPVNTDTPKPEAPRIKLPPAKPAPAVPAPPAKPAEPNGPKL